MPKLQLNFHNTFALKKEDLIKVLKAATEKQGLDEPLEVLMKRTGLGNCKVNPIKKWGIRGGLIEGKSLSSEGEIIFSRDSHLDSLLTDWFMHFNLSFAGHSLDKIPGSPAEWGGWPYFIYSFLPQYQTFTMEELKRHSSLTFDEESPKNLIKNFRIVLRAYTEPDALAGCKFLTKEKEVYSGGSAQLPNTYLIGYFLAKLWERDFPENDSILTESLINQSMGFSSVLGIKASGIQEQLDLLESYGIIEQRREVPPFQIIRRWGNPINLLTKSYDAER
jgi:hypothetical protein